MTHITTFFSASCGNVKPKVVKARNQANVVKKATFSVYMNICLYSQLHSIVVNDCKFLQVRVETTHGRGLEI